MRSAIGIRGYCKKKPKKKNSASMYCHRRLPVGKLKIRVGRRPDLGGSESQMMIGQLFTIYEQDKARWGRKNGPEADGEIHTTQPQ